MVMIKKSKKFAEASVTVIGITTAYSKPQYVLVRAEDGSLKFPGSRFSAPNSRETLEDSAKRSFEDMTGLCVSKMHGLRAIMPTRNQHNNG